MKRVQDALKSTGIPAFAGAWKATAENPTAPEQYLNLWCAGDPTDAIRRVRAAMREAGFAMREEGDSYNDDTDQTLVAWTWVCWEEAEA